jgi:hypothetical protein
MASKFSGVIFTLEEEEIYHKGTKLTKNTKKTKKRIYHKGTKVTKNTKKKTFREERKEHKEEIIGKEEKDFSFLFLPFFLFFVFFVNFVPLW